MIVTIASAWGYFSAVSKVVADNRSTHCGGTTVVTVLLGSSGGPS